MEVFSKSKNDVILRYDVISDVKIMIFAKNRRSTTSNPFNDIFTPILYLIIYRIYPETHLEHFKPPKPIYALQSAYLILFCLWNHFFGQFMNLQCSKWYIWPQNLRFCVLDHYFAQNVSLFATFRAYITYLCLAKYNFSIVSFA